MSRKWVLYALLLSVSAIWGATFAVMKEATKEFSPLLIVFCRVGGASFLLGLTLLFLGKKAKLYKEDIPLFFLLGLIGVSVFMPLQIYAVSFTYASHASMLIALTPVMATLIAWAIGIQKMNATIFVGLGLAVSGVVLLASQSFESALGAGILWGNGLILLSGIFWASFSLLGTKIMKHYPPIVAVGYIYLFGFAQLLCFSLLVQDHWPTYLEQIKNASTMGWVYIGFLSLCASYYSFFIWYRGIEILGPVKTTTFQYFNPLFGSLTAMLLLGEAITLYLLGGGIFIIGGVWLVNRSR
jgi:Predicted membrane protein